MKALRDQALLRKFRLCRADFIEALSSSPQPPNSRILRELAELQLVIMATEGAIFDKSDPRFLAEFTERAA